MKYTNFVFKNYTFDTTAKTLSLSYKLDDKVDFTETYRFDFEFVDNIDDNALDKAIQGLFFMAGVSYYKTYLPEHIAVNKGTITPELGRYLSKTYQKGLGEFYYVNKLDPNTNITFPVTNNASDKYVLPNQAGYLVGLGGGKDSLVTVEALRGTGQVTTWTLNHRTQLEPLVNEINLPHLQVERSWDKSLKEHNKNGAYNGHVPISAIFAHVGLIVAILSGKRDIVVSNEHAANEPTLEYRGVKINHQYSKSQEFEKDFQSYLNDNFGASIRYYSILRPFSELAISKAFVNLCFEKYKNVFSSCNRAFTEKSSNMTWCGECAKCAFTFLVLSPYADKDKLENIWHGNLLQDNELTDTYENLLGVSGDKPLDCVGEIAESRAAMTLVKKQYPELDRYKYSVEPFDIKKIYDHEIPDKEFRLICSILQ